MRYTVIGFYTDNDQVWATAVEAKEPQTAARKAVIEMLKTNGWGHDMAHTLRVVEVMQGKPKFAFKNENLVDGSEILGRSPKDWFPGERP